MYAKSGKPSTRTPYSHTPTPHSQHPSTGSRFKSWFKFSVLGKSSPDLTSSADPVEPVVMVTTTKKVADTVVVAVDSPVQSATPTDSVDQSAPPVAATKKSSKSSHVTAVSAVV